jgi:prepilin-type processing-associated H-X9-DG protein
MFAETIKSNIIASAGSFPLWNMNVYFVGDPFNTVDPTAGNCPNINPVSGSGYSVRIYYRGQMYYRNFAPTGYYAHTMTPNSTKPDCGYYNGGSSQPASAPLDFMAAHIAARSYHSGGINAAMVDGSVHFFKNSINLTTWRALGTMGAGEVLSADQY